MLRSVTLGVVLSVLVAACALVEQPVPAGTVPVQVTINNATAQEVPVAITSPTGVIPGAVRPTTSALAHTTTEVTFYIPSSGDWAISVGRGGSEFSRERLGEQVQTMLEGCRVYIDITADSISLDLCNPPL